MYSKPLETDSKFWQQLATIPWEWTKVLSAKSRVSCMYCFSPSGVENAIFSEVKITTPDTMLWPCIFFEILEFIFSANALYFPFLLDSSFQCFYFIFLSMKHKFQMFKHRIAYNEKQVKSHRNLNSVFYTLEMTLDLNWLDKLQNYQSISL